MPTSVADFHSTELTPDQARESAGQLGLPEVGQRHLWDGRVFRRRNAALVSRLAKSLPAEHSLLLAVATKDSDPLVREHATLALARVDGPLQDVVPALLRGLADKSEPVQAAARHGLYRLAESRRAEMAPHIIRALVGAPPEVAYTATDLLAAPECVHDLIAALDHAVRSVRQVVVSVLVRLADRAAPALARALEDPARRTIAAQVLLQLAPFGDTTRAELDRLVAGADLQLRGV